jgi:hypothetical protein
VVKMSERFVAATEIVSTGQSSSLLSDIIAAAFGALVGDISRLFDFSAPAYSTEELLRQVRISTRQLASVHLNALSQQFPKLPKTHLQPLANAQALLQSIKNQPLLSFGMQKVKPQEWETAQRLLVDAQHQWQRGGLTDAVKSARQAQRLLASGLREVHTRLAEAQHQIVVNSTIRSLREMGYKVQSARSSVGSWTALWATKGAKAIAVVVSPKSQLMMDMIGWEGTTCQAELIAFRQRMTQKGVQFREGRRYSHGRREGGLLIQEAAKVARENRVPFTQALLQVACRGRLFEQQTEQQRRQSAAILVQQQCLKT